MVNVDYHAARCQLASTTIMYDKSEDAVPLFWPEQVAVVTMGGDRNVKTSPRGVVTYMSTSREEDLRQLRKSLEALSKNFLQRHAYPVSEAKSREGYFA